MKKIPFLAFVFLLFSIKIVAQDTIHLSEQNADFSGIITINTLYSSYLNTPKTGGKALEIQGPKSGLYNFEKEHNTVWLSFKAEKTCTLEFEILPNSKNDDYDFLLFKPDSSEKKIRFYSNQKPIRSNISRNNESNNGKTGLSPKGDTSFVCYGIGNPYSTPILVVKGEKYLLVIDNVYGTGSGFSLSFHYSNCKEEELKKNERILNINVLDKKTKKSTSANLKIYTENAIGQPQDSIFSQFVSNCFLKVDAMKYYQLSVIQSGYFSQKIEFRVDSTEKNHEILVELDSMYVGRKLVLENLYFNGGSAEILRKSYPTLKKLLQVMKDNPSLVIEIQGHVNDPFTGSQRKTAEYNQELSDARAKAIMEYLSKRNIDKSRMTYKGFGNTQMLFPHATTPQEMEKNRRVEIEIIQF